MLYLLFIFYLILFCWIITRLNFFTESGLGNRLLIILFLVRIGVSLVGSYFNLYYYPASDSISFHNDGIVEYHLLFSNPHEYFTNLFEDTYNNKYSGLLDTTNSFWNNTKSLIIIKMLSIFDIFSGRNYIINTLFYNFLVFFGVVALYKVFIKIFPTSFYLLIACVFLLPSALFFTSMIHRDGLTLLSLSMVIYHTFFMMKRRQFSWKRLVIILLFLLLLFLVRNFVFITLIPALISWIFATYKPKFAFVSFVGIYVMVTILFFCSGFISAKTDLPRYVSERQSAFVEISKLGASSINIQPLEPNFKSFLINAPQALNHALMRPYVTEINSFVYVPFALEIVLYELLFLIFIFFRKRKLTIDPLEYFCLFFAVTMFIVIGYTVPILGAIVRYRSIFFIFLLVPIFCHTDFKKLSAKFT